jgi:predicted nucleic acid-binding protein
MTAKFLSKRAGNPIGPMDLLNAAHAVVLSATLVTNNAFPFLHRPTQSRSENFCLKFATLQA